MTTETVYHERLYDHVVCLPPFVSATLIYRLPRDRRKTQLLYLTMSLYTSYEVKL